MITTADVLRDAKALIADPGHWAQVDAVTPNDCTGHCALTAIWTAGYKEDAAQPTKLAEDAIARAVNSTPRGVADWNDAKTTSHADVMAAFDRAIAAEEGSA